MDMQMTAKYGFFKRSGCRKWHLGSTFSLCGAVGRREAPECDAEAKTVPAEDVCQRCLRAIGAFQYISEVRVCETVCVTRTYRHGELALTATNGDGVAAGKGGYSWWVPKLEIGDDGPSGWLQAARRKAAWRSR